MRIETAGDPRVESTGRSSLNMSHWQTTGEAYETRRNKQQAVRVSKLANMLQHEDEQPLRRDERANVYRDNANDLVLTEAASELERETVERSEQ
jgi:23S rRNA maturation mini-RNase III